MKFLIGLLALTIMAGAAIPNSELDAIGRRVWKNECAGTRDGLTSWNAGEKFASLGIGHFIWYPAGLEGPFEESFPKLVGFLNGNGQKLPAWLVAAKDCPWKTKEEFEGEFRSARMEELRALLASTIRLQSRFLALRMQRALPKMLEATSASERARVRTNFERLLASGPGTFALIDYVNFKGEGTNPAERYQGQGWGLLQVLGQMQLGGQAPQAFGVAASEVLERRVHNAPATRNERQWLAGWKSRVRSYGQ